MLLKACIILVNVSIIKTQLTIPQHASFCMGDVCYIKFESTSESNWTEAQKTCRRNGLTLPIVDDSTHQKSFEAAVRCLTAEDEQKSGIWIGAKASYSNPKNWTWLDGSNYTETEVPSQEGYDKSYAFLQDASPEEGPRAFASDPKGNYFYICQYSTPADLCTNGTGLTVENGCFVKFEERMSWFSARNACLSNGGDLASFSNISLLDEKIGRDGVWVGLRSSQWNWQHAVALTGSSSDVTFTLWNSGEPNDNAPTCISTDEDEKFPNWRDYSCSQSLPFICQYTRPTFPPLNPSLAICPTPIPTIPKNTDAASPSLRSATIGKNRATTPSVSSTIPSVSPNEVKQKNDTDPVDIALAVGLGVGIGVPVVLALVVVVIVISVRRKRRNSNAGENSKSRETVSKNRQAIQENDRMEMSETQNGQPHYHNFSAASQYATIPASSAAGPKLDAPSTQGTVYADLSFNQAGSS